MGKKGVKLDNGRNAQSSMALYWKKHHQQSKKPKKQYEPTEQQQFDQRVESGFQKWKQHKQKIMEKSFIKKEEEPQKHDQAKKDQIESEEEQEIEINKFKTKGIVKIPGFKSKQGLKQRLRPQQKKQVDQSDNVLKLPIHMAGLTQDDIIRILKQKKAQTELAKKKRKNEQVEDVILGEDFLESFKAPPKSTEEELQKQMEKKKQQQLEKEKEKEKEKQFFKSNILNEISKGNFSALIPQKITPQVVSEPVLSPPTQKIEQETSKKGQQHVRPLFKPRVLGNNH